MANTVENTFNKVGNVLEQIFGTASTQQPDSNRYNNGGKQTCLEKMGMEARKYHLLRNEWRKDLAYSKPLVDAEYLIQTEFKIDGGYDVPTEESKDKIDRKIDKLNQKKAKLEEKIEKLNTKRPKERL